MPKFNIEEYEPVEERLSRFHKQYKEGRVITEMVEYTDDRVVFKAYLFRSFEEEKPWATGYAEETRGQGGVVNATSHLENCETSAIGRALANAGYAPKGKRPSREEMTKVRNKMMEEARASRSAHTTLVEEEDSAVTAVKEIKRLYAITAKLNPGAQNIGNRVTKMVVEKGYAHLNQMPGTEIKALADDLEKQLAK